MPNSLKSFLFGFLYPLLCVFLPCILYQVAFRKKHSSHKIPLSHFIWSYIFILYIYMVLSVTGISTLWDIGSYPELIRPEEIHFIPFQSGFSILDILNIIMFVSLVFLLPLLWQKYRRLPFTIIAGAGFSLFIELVQLFNCRQTDSSDLIMNTLGAVAGYFLWFIFHKLFGKRNMPTPFQPSLFFISVFLLPAQLSCIIPASFYRYCIPNIISQIGFHYIYIKKQACTQGCDSLFFNAI